MRCETSPVVLTIAGSDSGGEAGVQADLKTFAAMRVHGATSITCITAQNIRRVTQLEPVSPKMVRAQLEAVAELEEPSAAKTGMLYSAAIVLEVVRFFKLHPKIPFVVDPVMVSSSGRRLLQLDGVKVLREKLLPLATMVTPNIEEAEILIDAKIQSPSQAEQAAETIFLRYGCAVIVKGGHLKQSGESIDFYSGPEGKHVASTVRLKGRQLHGTGCTFSAALAARLALGKTHIDAFRFAKNYINKRIAESQLAVRARQS